MNRAALLSAAYLADQVAGDPEWFPHPVRLMGQAISRGEKLLRRPDDSSTRELIAGAALTAGLVCSSWYFTHLALRLAHRQSRSLGRAVEVFLAWTCLAARNLQQEAESVAAALECDDLPAARIRLARIVGRDTQALDAEEISRALIETLAESISDGVIAPLLYLAAGGVPLAMAYKAVNTLDSMIGHRDERYLYFGRAAARLDDAANFVPARIAALVTVAAAAASTDANAQTAWMTWRQDGDRHKSPNAGQPEAAMAGALQVRLGGDNFYAAELIRAQRLGSQFPAPTAKKARQAMRLTAMIAGLGLAAAVLAAVCSQRRSM